MNFYIMPKSNIDLKHNVKFVYKKNNKENLLNLW